MTPESLKLLVQAGNPIISMETPDEPRAVRLVREVAQADAAAAVGMVGDRRVWCRVPPEPSETLVEPGKVVAALRYVKDSRPIRRSICSRTSARTARTRRSSARSAISTFRPIRGLWTLVLIDAVGLPPEVRRLTVPFDGRLAGRRGTRRRSSATPFRRSSSAASRQVESKLTKRELEMLVQTLRGLTTEEAVRVVSGAIHDDNVLDRSDLPRVVDAKRNLLGTTGCLESIAADVSPDEIGGLNNLKRWLNLRYGGFTARAREFGLDPPRGILLLGVQGCGKSLCAKVVASAWRMPLLRMDPGVLYQKYIGESEARLREALRQAESMSPVVLWIDEIEKAFASASSDSADGGLSQRMFGTLLSWMQDHRHPIFLIATANNLAQLPPELMRKGPFRRDFLRRSARPGGARSDLRGPPAEAAARQGQVRHGPIWWRPPTASPAPRSSRRSFPGCMRRLPTRWSARPSTSWPPSRPLSRFRSSCGSTSSGCGPGPTTAA